MSHIIRFSNPDVRNSPRPWPVEVDDTFTVLNGLGSDDGALLIGFGPLGAQRIDVLAEDGLADPSKVIGMVPSFANGGIFEWSCEVASIEEIVPVEVIMDPHFILDIRMGNAGMQDGLDIATALRDIADRLAPDGYGSAPDIDESHDVLDTNGQKVGTWTYKEVAR